MNKPIIDPSQLTEEQRKAITELFTSEQEVWKNPQSHNSDYFGALFKIELLERIFGKEYFERKEDR